MSAFGLPVVVALNRFADDTDNEIAVVEKLCRKKNVELALSCVFAKGSEGGLDLARKVIAACEKESSLEFTYTDDMTIEEKISAVAGKIYGADGVDITPAAKKAIAEIKALDESYARLPICIAKTQYSLSDDPAKLGRPTGFRLSVRDVRLSAGAGFIVVLTGDIMTMPGLSKQPAAYSIDVDDDGNITGLF